jgi:hypothetical protein
MPSWGAAPEGLLGVPLIACEEGTRPVTLAGIVVPLLQVDLGVFDIGVGDPKDDDPPRIPVREVKPF